MTGPDRTGAGAGRIVDSGAVDRHAELEVTAIHARLDELTSQVWEPLIEMQRRQMDLLARLDALTGQRHPASTDDPATPERPR